MIKIEIWEDQLKCLETKGECREIVAEVGVAIGIMYNKIRMENPEAAEQFKGAIMLAMMPFSPVWEKHEMPGGVSQCIAAPKNLRKEGGA